MIKAAKQFQVENWEEELENSDTKIYEVSWEGTWQKRGNSSLNGVVRIIASDTGKYVDYWVLLKTYNTCASWECRKESEPGLHDQFLSIHQYPINHEGSAGSLGTSGVVKCFQRSLSKKHLRYTQYNSDGDSKAYSEVVKSDPYHGVKSWKAWACLSVLSFWYFWDYSYCRLKLL